MDVDEEDDLINSILDEKELAQDSPKNDTPVKIETEEEDYVDETLEENRLYVEKLKKYFGYSSFRPLQLNIIKNVVGNRDKL